MMLCTSSGGVAAGFKQAECSWIREDNWDMRRGSNG